MRKDLGVKPYLFPMPVLMIATYGSDDVVDVMNMAWGGICSEDMVALNISEDHKTTDNIKKRKAFTVSIASLKYMDEADYFGIASGNKVSDKFARTGLTAIKSKFVDAPIIDEFPVTLECELVEAEQTIYDYRVLGRIKNVSVREEVLTEGKVDPSKIQALIFDQFQNGYYVVGEKVGQAWKNGIKYVNKK